MKTASPHNHLNQAQGEYKHSLTFHLWRYTHLQYKRLQAYIRVCFHSSETSAPIANPPNSAQLKGTPYHSPKLHQFPCSSVGMRRGTDRQTHTETHGRPWQVYIFVSAIPHAKCNYNSVYLTSVQPSQHPLLSLVTLARLPITSSFYSLRITGRSFLCASPSLDDSCREPPHHLSHSASGSSHFAPVRLSFISHHSHHPSKTHLFYISFPPKRHRLLLSSGLPSRTELLC